MGTTLGVPLEHSARLATSCKCYPGTTLYKGGDMEGLNMIFVISLNMLCNAASYHLFMGLGRRASKTMKYAVFKIRASVNI